MSRRSALQLLGDVTGEQWGMVTTAQARRAGVSSVDFNRLVHDGILVPASDAARVYRIAGAPDDPDMDPLRAAWLQLGGARWWHERIRAIDAVVSHRSAAHLRRLGDLIPVAHEMYVSHRRQPRRRDVRLRLRSDLAAIPWDTVGGLPCTTPLRLVDDLLTIHEDESAIAQICRDALSDGHLTREQIEPLAAGHAARYGHRTTDEMIAALTASSVDTGGA